MKTSRILGLLACLLLPLAAEAGPSSRAGASVVGVREASTGTTLSTSAGTFTTGNTIVVATSIYSPGTEEINSVTDGVNTYTALTACEDSGNNRLRIFYSVNVTGGTRAITMTPSASVDYAAIVASEYAGVFAVDVAVPCASGTGTTLTSGSFTTTTGTLIYVAGVSGNAAATLTPGAGYALHNDDWFTGRGTDEDRVSGAAQSSITATMTQNVSAAWLIAGVSLKSIPDAAAGTAGMLLGVSGGAGSGCSGCVPIQTTDVAQTIVSGQPAGATFLLKAGYHRLDSISPRDGDTYVGEPGAILSGSKVLASGSFATSGSFWKITGQTQTPATRIGTCQLTLADNPSGIVAWATSYPGCSFAEELFFDDVRFVHVQTLAEVGAGKWYFNDATDEITVGTNPAGHTVETSVTTYAFNNTGNNVTVKNLTVEKYASPAQYGAIDAENTSGWIVADSVLRNNHSGGIRIGDGLHLLRTTVTLNGEIGVVGIGINVLVQACTVTYNNAAHFDPGWEGGGTKFVLTDGLIVAGSTFSHNEGPGLWLDIDNINYTLTGNTVASNDQMGIFVEISYVGIVSNNTVTGNGLAYWVPNYIWGTGILVAASPDVEITGNTLSGNRGGIAGVQQNRGTGTYGVHVITGLNVHLNTVTIDVAAVSPTWNGLVDDTGSATIFVSDNNHFEANTYFLKGNTNYFVWNNVGDRSFSAWQGFGHDTPVGSATVN